MSSKSTKHPDAALVRQWELPAAATLGSSVRARGILLEIRAHLPSALKKSLDIEAGSLALRLPEGADAAVRSVSETVTRTLDNIENLPVIPREIEDILTISTTERHRWLKYGRLPSAGTRTVRLAGRAKKITFHVFDPRQVEDILDRDLVSAWREDDVATAAENRRRAAWKAKLKRAGQGTEAPDAQADDSADSVDRPRLIGWEEFERDGPLR